MPILYLHNYNKNNEREERREIEYLRVIKSGIDVNSIRGSSSENGSTKFVAR
jgi:hypothetical protein